jgi:NADH-quinone oxidoreductase subunit I
MFCGLCEDECPVECLKMGKKVTMAGWAREDIVKDPDFLATKRFSAKEVADLEAEAKKIAAEKAAAKKAAAKDAPAKEGAAKKPAKEGAVAAEKKKPEAKAKTEEGGAS